MNQELSEVGTKSDGPLSLRKVCMSLVHRDCGRECGFAIHGGLF